MITETITKPAHEMTAKELEVLLKEAQEKEREGNEKNRHAYEELRNQTVENLCCEASAISGAIKDFGKKVFSDLEAQYGLLKEYSDRHEKGKGNFTIANADKTMRVSFKANETFFFDERSQQAEKHIIDFVGTQFVGDPKTQKLITGLLERSKGKLDIKLVQKLYSMENEYDDNNWREGIRLLKESWTQGKTRFYARFEVLINDSWTAIIMDFAALCNQN